MIEKSLRGSSRYWAVLAALGGVALVGVLTYLYQFKVGLGVTGLSRDIPWGLYIAQFTFLVGVAASAVMVVLPYYLHSHKEFGRMTVLGEFVAISAVLMCMMFIFVDMGQPTRMMNMVLHPTFNSLMFWDMTVLFGYLVLNVTISRVTFGAEAKRLPPPQWIKPLIYLSIPWAFSIHTVTAFLYCGLGARPFWFTAILAPRFLASAFAAGPALLILLGLLLRKYARFDVGAQALRSLSVIAAYAMALNVFFILLELFTALYSGMPEHTSHFQYLFLGLKGKSLLVPWTWTSVVLALVAVVLLVVPQTRNNEKLLPWTCVAVVLSLWIEKGLELVVAGFVPSVSGAVTEYHPTIPEVLIAVGVYAIWLIVLTVLVKVAVSVRRELWQGVPGAADAHASAGHDAHAAA